MILLLFARLFGAPAVLDALANVLRVPARPRSLAVPSQARVLTVPRRPRSLAA